jgi:outer membrane receptor for ferrienterochelin and colicins
MRLGLLLFALTASRAYGQSAPADTIPSYEMDPVVVTATRTPKELADVAVPTTVVSIAELRERGAMRLTDALAELAGLSIAHDHGAGLQVQGFDADYTLILIDGEPVIGRTAGTLDLERLALSGIERVEIVRGPSSSLYGSEALAGVVNLITAKAEEPLGLSVGSRYGTHGTSVLSAVGEASLVRAGVRLVADRYRSNGYDLSPDLAGSTTPAFVKHTLDLRAHAELGARTTATLGARWAEEDQIGRFALAEPAGESQYEQIDRQADWSIHPEIQHRISRHLHTEFSLYHARFGVDSRQERTSDAAVFFQDSARQRYGKAEVQLNGVWNTRHFTVLGAGAVHEGLAGDRYGENRPVAGSRFIFAQHEWLATPRLDVSLSARFDTHDDYASRLSPKLALLVRPSSATRLRFSAGSGFKAPDFRQRYLSFTNAASGYSVFGVTQLEEGLDRLAATGQIEAVFVDPTAFGQIGAERSFALNAGASLALGSMADLTVALFHNNVRDLIETLPVAQKTNGSFVYSYVNLSRMYTRGVQLEATVHPSSPLRITASYQWLQAHDRTVLDAIDAGTLFGRTLAGRDYRLARSDYPGLFGRSTHSGTAAVAYAPSSVWSLTVRAVWRGRYGYRDLDGNEVANLEEERVTGYTLWHATLNRSWMTGWGTMVRAQVGVENALDVLRPTQIPSLPGRTVFAGLHIDL